MQQAANDATTAAAPDALAAAHGAVFADRTLQTQFTEFKPQPPPDWLRPLAEFIRSISPILGYIFWAGVIVVVAIILYTLVAEIRRRMPSAQKTAPEAVAPEPYRPTAARARALLEEADRLAAAGHYGEAVRVLLHRSIDDFEATLNITIGPSLTSREIARLQRLSPRGRDTFSQLAVTVERSLFAGQPLSADAFAQCRAAYQAFASDGARR